MILALLVTALAADPYVEVLGIAQDGGHPQAGCTASHCAPETGRHHVASLAIVDPDTSERWLIEATPDFPTQLGAGPLSGIFLTHGHIGHYTGLMYLGREAMGANRVKVWAMPRMEQFLSRNGPWDQLVAQHHITLQPLRHGTPISIGRVTVEPFRVPHRDEYTETVGFLVRGPSKQIAWLPDVDKWEKLDPALEALLDSVDIAFLDGTFFDANEVPGRDMAEIPHPLVLETLQRLHFASDQARAKVRLIHLNHTNPLLDPDSAERRRVEAAHLQVAVEGDRYPL